MEKNSPTLQSISSDFYSQVASLLLSEEKHRTYLEKLIEEIYGRRKNKIVLHAVRSESLESLPQNVIPLEVELYKDVVELLKKHKKLVLEQKPQIKKEDKPVEGDKITVRIVRAIPAIVGPDLNSYGPFKEDNVVELPVESAKILIERGYAEGV